MEGMWKTCHRGKVSFILIEMLENDCFTSSQKLISIKNESTLVEIVAVFIH